MEDFADIGLVFLALLGRLGLQRVQVQTVDAQADDSVFGLGLGPFLVFGIFGFGEVFHLSLAESLPDFLFFFRISHITPQKRFSGEYAHHTRRKVLRIGGGFGLRYTFSASHGFHWGFSPPSSLRNPDSLAR